ncbi:S-layer homology domain-containing protein [Ureibacillus manganicus]|uniref:S-layer homology domain-containing protein n=1 Tax=Ureibacillus manganicus TaxID=1266064 RepID=UPI00068AC7C5|nr:S-layer homology domain-containing protein [Ureibacillus manganicus]
MMILFRPLIYSKVFITSTKSVLQIEVAKRTGIVFGDLEGNFNPHNKITREDMTAMLMRALEYKEDSRLEATSTSNKFADENNISTYAIDAIQKATALNIIKDIGNNKFAPKKDTTRAEAAVMLYQVLKLLEEI